MVLHLTIFPLRTSHWQNQGDDEETEGNCKIVSVSILRSRKWQENASLMWAQLYNRWECIRCLVAQSCPALFDPMDCSPPASSVHGILQERILEWVVIPSPGDLPNPGIEPASSVSPVLQADSLPTEPSGKPITDGLEDSFPFCTNNVTLIW